MDVILLQDVEHVGLKGDVVDVKRGYARNYLLPRRLAEVATPGALAQARNVEAQRARQEARSTEQAEEIAAILAETVLRFDVKAGPTGSLFGSVTATDVAEELWRARKVRVDRRKLDMDSIKRIGRYTITVAAVRGGHRRRADRGRPRRRRAAARGGARRDGGRRGRGGRGRGGGPRDERGRARGDLAEAELEERVAEAEDVAEEEAEVEAEAAGGASEAEAEAEPTEAEPRAERRGRAADAPTRAAEPRRRLHIRLHRAVDEPRELPARCGRFRLDNLRAAGDGSVPSWG